MKRAVERRAARLLAIASLWLCGLTIASPVWSQPLPTVEWHLRQNAEQRLTAFGDDMFGDEIDPHTGGISFLHTDVSLPGNSALDVSISRRRVQGVLPAGANADFGDWELLVPRIKLTTAWNRPWTGNRCSSSFGSFLTGVVINGDSLTRDEYSNGATVEVGASKEQLLETPTGAQWPAGTTHVTKNNWRFTCTTASDGGQGFIGQAPNGDTYQFNRVIVLDAEPLDSVDNLDLERKIYVLAATQVTDLSGNWVQYTYNASGQLTQIQSNDGRLITLTYHPSTNIIQTVTANGRTWTYAYGGLSYSYPFWKSPAGDPAPGETLKQVTLPDGRQWLFTLDGMAPSTAPAPGCWESHTISVTHPAGATATFDLSLLGHRYWLDRQVARSGGQNGCPVDYGVPQGAPWPIRNAASTQVMSVVKKEVTGLSIATATWTYEYENDLTTNTSASDPTNWTKVTGPGIHITYLHKWTTYPEGGALLKKEVRQTAGGSVLDTLEYQYFTENAIGNAAHASLISQGDLRRSRRTTEVKTTRGTDWWRMVNTFDTNFASATYSFGAPLTVAKDSNVSTTARTSTTVYIHNKPIWVLALPDTTSVNGRAINKFYYDALGRKTAEDLYGVRVADYAYHTSAGQMGAIHWFKDALNRTTYALNWHRGSPQQITRADGSNVYQTIDNNGWLTSTTDAKGFVTSYGWDNMGRLISYAPTGWTATTHSYAFSGWGAVQTITKGIGRTTISYDNRWQPTLVTTEDLGTGWESNVTMGYDARGRLAYESYPSAAPNWSYDIGFTYDALNRMVSKTAPGSAITTFQYLNGHIRRVIDPVGNQTDSYFTGYDGPDSKEIIRILQPLTTNTYINRNAWGEIESVRQVGTQNGYPVDFTQYHYYDAQRRRCGYSTPEAGDTLFAYNNANELTDYQKGATGASTCPNPGGAVPSGNAKVTQSYDLLGRLTTTNYADAGTPDITRGYDANSNLTSLTRGISAWTYQHNALNLPTQEKLVIDGRTYQTDYGYNAAGALTQTAFPGGPTVVYAPDGLGRATKAQASGSTNYATTLQYHPNGALSGFTYGNGYVFGQTLTNRQMPLQITSVLGATKAADLTFGYTLNDQINAITDAADAGNNRTFTYDGLGRLLTSTGQWGSGSYTYDAVGNLRQRAEGSRTVQTQYDASNRLSQMRDTATGNVWRTYIYDARGSATFDANTQHTIGYDYADQPTSMSKAGFSATYVYDGNFRRVKQVAGGKTIYSVYSLSGALLHRDDITTPKRVSFVSVGGKTIAEITTAGVATYFHNDQLGSPVSSTNAGGAILWREQYTPYGESLESDAAHADNIGFTGHVEDATGLTYMQARYYDPVVGRFLAIDPVEFSAGRPDMFNRYAYVGNDPLNEIDPDGRKVVIGGGVKSHIDTLVSLAYLAKSETFKQEFAQIMNSDTVYTLKAGADFEFDPATNTVTFDPTSGQLVKSSGEIQSPALGLGHEVAHAAQKDRIGEAAYDASIKEPSSMKVDEAGRIILTREVSPEEARATAIEGKIAAELGEPQRESYTDQSGSVETKSPTSRVPK